MFYENLFLSTFINAKVDGTNEIRESVTAKNLQLQIPIFSIAFGEQADFKFLNQISEMNKGFARRVYEENDATLQVTKSWLFFVIHCLTNFPFFLFFNPSLSNIFEYCKSNILFELFVSAGEVLQ